MKYKYTTQSFIEKAKEIHGDNYNYEFVEYKNALAKIKIVCNRCGKEFFQRAEAHLRGQGCSHCNEIHSKELFIKKAQFIHGNKYDYSEVIYDGCYKPVKIWCNTCKKYFWQKPVCHLDKAGCQTCGILKNQTCRRSNKQAFVEKAVKLYRNKYSYDEVKYINTRTKVKIHCNICNSNFEKTPSSFLSGSECPFCKISKGEQKIKIFLEDNCISFKFQKRFLDCVDKYSLPFDFYLPDYNICIEFQGEQHYKPNFHINRNKDEKLGLIAFKEQQKHDKIKKEYCKKRKIKLLEIKYNENIEKRLKQELNLK